MGTIPTTSTLAVHIHSINIVGNRAECGMLSLSDTCVEVYKTRGILIKTKGKGPRSVACVPVPTYSHVQINKYFLKLHMEILTDQLSFTCQF